MIKIDEKFLDEVGLSSMPDDKKAEFIAQTREEFQHRVGEKMSEGLTVDQLREFNGIINNDRKTMVRVLSRIGDFRQDSLYNKLLKKHGVTEGTLEILGEYLSVKWVQMNRPDYAAISENVARELKSEIIEARPMILGA
jgi:hypothetical protein